MPVRRATLLTQARTFLRAVDGIGVVAERIGQMPTWEEQPNSTYRSFWQVSAPLIARAHFADQRHYSQRVTLVLEGWMPWNDGTAGNTATEALWLNLVDSVCDALNADFDVAGALVEETGDLQPQLVADDRRPFDGAKYTALCHYAQITLTVVFDDGGS